MGTCTGMYTGTGTVRHIQAQCGIYRHSAACSGMFRHVSACSGMSLRVPAYLSLTSACSFTHFYGFYALLRPLRSFTAFTAFLRVTWLITDYLRYRNALWQQCNTFSHRFLSFTFYTVSSVLRFLTLLPVGYRGVREVRISY